jgi:hypothetical protein
MTVARGVRDAANAANRSARSPCSTPGTSSPRLRARGGIAGHGEDLARLTPLLVGPAPWMAEIV